jgi:hypothetical protein
MNYFVFRTNGLTLNTWTRKPAFPRFISSNFDTVLFLTQKQNFKIALGITFESKTFLIVVFFKHFTLLSL